LAVFCHAALVSTTTSAVLNLVHQPAHDVDTESAGLTILGKLNKIWLPISCGVEGFTLIPDADGEAIRFDDDSNIDTLFTPTLVRVFDYVGTGFIDRHLQLLHNIRAELRIRRMLRHKLPHIFEIAR
jgi:hypothetical protein